eukprot:1726521-Amphidinium_carterae.1
MLPAKRPFHAGMMSGAEGNESKRPSMQQCSNCKAWSKDIVVECIAVQTKLGLICVLKLVPTANIRAMDIMLTWTGFVGLPTEVRPPVETGVTPVTSCGSEAFLAA